MASEIDTIEVLEDRNLEEVVELIMQRAIAGAIKAGADKGI